VYPMSMAQYLMGGPPDRVHGEQWVGTSGVDEAFAGQLYYSGGRLAQIFCSFRTPFHTSVEVIGTEGRLFLNYPFVGLEESRLRFYPAGGEVREIATPDKELYLGQVEDMHAAILDGAPNYLTLTETRNHVKTALALYESARTGEVVRLS